MLARIARAVLIILTGFLAISAAGGGLALVGGFNCPPPGLLVGTPFSSYVVPGMCLLILVGGLALWTAIAIVRSHPSAPYLTFAVGCSILIFEFVEIIAIGSPKGVARNLQILYFSLGLLLLSCQFIGMVPLLESRPRT